MERNKKIVITITSILVVLVLIVGVTYALEIFQSTSGDNTIKSGKISMNYTESSNVINIENALPMTDEAGKQQTNYFDFSITSNAQTNADDNDGIKIPYNLIIEPKTVDTDKTALTNDQIKVYLTKIESGTETVVLEPVKISELTAAATNYNLYSTENVHKNNNGMITTKYRLRAWIDYNVESNDFNTKTYQYKFAINVNATGNLNTTAPKKSGADRIIEKVGTGGLIAESHPATEQLVATTAYRYTGANPDNYIRFNNEVWRIIGIFDVDDGTGNIEKRIKIIRDTLGNIAWSSDNVNDWSKATGMQLLNIGDYYNRRGSYASNGLTAEAKNQIADAKWYLGGTNSYTSASNGLASHFYGYERGTTVYSGRPTSWVGKVGLMYPSDYGYATSGGTTTNREACLAKEMLNWNSSSYSYCKDNDWLYDSSNHQWTLAPSSGYSHTSFLVVSSGYVGPDYLVYDAHAVRPTLYMRSDIQISGSGTSASPYEISLN